MIKLLERLDFFKEPVYLRIDNRKHLMGSAFGGICSVLMSVLLLGVTAVISMGVMNPETDIVR